MLEPVQLPKPSLLGAGDEIQPRYKDPPKPNGSNQYNGMSAKGFVSRCSAEANSLRQAWPPGREMLKPRDRTF